MKHEITAGAGNLIIGCGYLGQRVAKLWLAQGRRVVALTRTRASELSALGIDPIIGDVLTPPDNLPCVDTVLYAVGLDRTSGRSFREVYVDGLRRVLDALPAPRRFIYVSSTSVYGQTDGSWVNESSQTEPLEENGRIVLEAESLLRARLPEAIILRLAGIYGPGRMIRRAAIEKGEPLVGDFDKRINLIHVEDGARVVLAAEAKGKPGATYLVSDGQPVTRREFYTYMAKLLGVLPPVFKLEPSSSGDPIDRRIANRKMMEELAVELAYPNYREGLRASLDDNLLVL